MLARSLLAVVVLTAILAGAKPRAQTADPRHLLDLAAAYLDRYERDMARTWKEQIA